MNAARYYAKKVASYREMASENTDLEFAESMSRKCIELEAMMFAAAENLCMRRKPVDALTEEARHQNRMQKALADLKSIHEDLSLIAAERGLIPVPTEGGR